MRMIVLLGGIFLSVLLSGCNEEKPAVDAPPDAASTAPADPRPARAEKGTPQPKLPTVKLWVGTNEVNAEVARTIPQITTGMMWRTNMSEMDGMLFVFRGPQQVAFYMRNTLVPLTCAYIDPQGTIVELHDMTPRDETPIPSGSPNIQYVLEMNQGWFTRHGVRPGMAITTQYGSLEQTFSNRR